MPDRRARGGDNQVLTRLSLLASVVPRSIASSLDASRRSVVDGSPPCRLGARLVGESMLDEFFVAASAVVRSVPLEVVVEAAVARCDRVADDLAALGVVGCNVAPRPLVEVGSIVRRLGSARFERLDYDSAPAFPDAVQDIDRVGSDVACVRVLRHPDGPRPWVVWIHGAGQGRSDDLISLRAQHLYADLGMNVALPVLPRHGRRRRRYEPYPGFDPLVNIAVTIRAVHEVRSVVEWIARQEPASIAVVGLSLGAPIAALVAELEPLVDAVGVVVPMLDLHGTLAHHLSRGGDRGRRLATLLRSEPVRRAGAAIDPLPVEPFAHPDRRLVMAACNDRVTSVRAAGELHERWGGEVHWHQGGHIGHLLSADSRSVVDDFLRSDIGSRDRR